MHAATGGVEVHGGQPQAALGGALDVAQALHLRQRNPGRGAGEAAGGGDDARVGMAPGQIAAAQRRLPPRPAGHGIAVDGRVGDRSAPAGARACSWLPTGSTARSDRPCASFSRLRFCLPATSTSSRHQPNGRHSSGSIIFTACTRPRGIVSAVVAASPLRIRSPSAPPPPVSLYSPLKRRRRPPPGARGSERDEPPRPRRRPCAGRRLKKTIIAITSELGRHPPAG